MSEEVKKVGFLKRNWLTIVLGVLVILGALGCGLAYMSVSGEPFYPSPHGVNYAYKDITGINSPYLIPWESEKYVIDSPLNYEGRYEELSDEEKDSYLETGFDGKSGVLQNLYPEDREVIETLEHSSTNIYKMAGGLFEDIGVITNEWDVAKAVEDTKARVHVDRVTENLKAGIETLVDGVWKWDYKKGSKVNQKQFMAFRVGQGIYAGRVSSIPLIYERKLERVKENKVRVTPEYNVEEAEVYVHPIEGGYAVDLPLKLNIEINGEKYIENVRYVAILASVAPNPTDIWPLWCSVDYEYLTIYSHYITEDLKGGYEK